MKKSLLALAVLGTLAGAGQAGYYGYHYKLLTSQGPHAPGGAYNYVVN
ncbi:hypothetical protein P3T23_008361, partial [Paraburkholderia sp. GAS448]